MPTRNIVRMRGLLAYLASSQLHLHSYVLGWSAAFMLEITAYLHKLIVQCQVICMCQKCSQHPPSLNLQHV